MHYVALTDTLRRVGFHPHARFLFLFLSGFLLLHLFCSLIVMVMVMAAASSSSSSSSSMAAADQLVKVEIEAAEALADLAAFAARENGPHPPELNWRTKRKPKRSRTEVKTESLPNPLDLQLRIQDRGVVSHPPSEKDCAIQSQPEWKTTRKMLKADKEEAESLEVNPTCTSSYPLFGCRRSSRNLTEAEKEERRIRRILANRESARQTIRRRQAVCEDLTRKAADLAWENENLKREKELALKEYQSLETTNRELKEQMAQAVKPKEQEIPGNNISSHVQVPPLPTNYPLFLFSRPPYASYFWPSVVQPSSPYHELHNVVVVPPSIHLPANNTVTVSDSSHVQENFMAVNGLRTPFCILPCSWLLPHHDHRNQQSPEVSCPTGINQEVIHSNSQNSAYTSKVDVRAESKRCPLLSAEEKTEQPALNKVPNLNEALNSKDHSQNTVGVAVEGFEPPSAVEQDNRSEDDLVRSSRTYHGFCDFTDKRHEPNIIFPYTKTIDAMAATEARRRRKELTKLKNLHTRECRMHS